MASPEAAVASKDGADSGTNPTSEAPPTAANQDAAAVTGDDGVNPLDFEGSVHTSDDLPTLETIRKIDHYTVLDKDGKSHTFRSLYTGRHTARRVLIIFIRHFFCGNCQQYLRIVSESITPQSLLSLPSAGGGGGKEAGKGIGTTFICVVGCGDPALIDMYANATGCPYPIYADPTRRLYAELGMVRTLALGPRPDYMRVSLAKIILDSIAQGLGQVGKGLAHKGGDAKQVGGEFLFEPVVEGGAGGVPETPIGIGPPPAWDKTKVEGGARSETSLDGKGEPDSEGVDKVVTWCHRMRNTRDHADIPTLMKVLGLDGGERAADVGKSSGSGR
ncbi:AhpC/TSA antioxidant enzyme-domain-containing protein [Corynascus similis CBS 632.67]